MSRKRILILGSTGSIGLKTLEVIRDYPDRFEVAGLCAHASVDALRAQAREFRPRAACVTGPLGREVARDAAAKAGSGNGGNGSGGGRGEGTVWLAGPEGAVELIEACEPDFVVSSMVGAAGLEPTMRALELGLAVGLANKEVLVTAGEAAMAAARRSGSRILPIDSEHNAIFQLLDGRAGSPLRRVILTASGGPFRGWSADRLETVTVEQALRHPTWTMGRKITIDSATLMNKGFEAIEARWLFDVPIGMVEVVVHPQSVIHSMVEFHDGSMLAQLGRTDMYFPIANALAWPERLENTRFAPLDLTELGSMTFEKPDRAAFPCLGLAQEAVARGRTWPAVLNAANEIAVERFLAGEIRFTEIHDVIDAAMQAHEPAVGAGETPGLDAIREADAWARGFARPLSFSRSVTRD